METHKITRGVELKAFGSEAPGLAPAARHALEYVGCLMEMRESGMIPPVSCSLSVAQNIGLEFMRFMQETELFMKQRGEHFEWRAHLKQRGY